MVDGRPGGSAGSLAAPPRRHGDALGSTVRSALSGTVRSALSSTVRSALRRWLRVPVLGYGLFATLALAAIWRVGDSSTPTYTLALFAFAGLLPALPAAVAALFLPGWWRLPGLALLVAPLTVLAVVWGPTAVPGRAGDPASADLRVATFNRTHGAPLDPVLALVDAAAPDVLLLQEVTRPTAAELADTLAGVYPHQVTTLDRGGDTAVLSTLPVVGVEPVTGLPDAARAADVVVLADGDRRLAVVSVHLASPCVLCSAGKQGENPAGSTSTSLLVRAGETARYTAIVRELHARGLAVVFGGDLNSSELNEPMRALAAAGLVDVHRAVGLGPQLTRAGQPGVARVDALFVAGLVPVDDAEGAAGPSTHSPVVADLAWPDGG